nr:hypothetical protein CFP56_74801 [Quercus suber]
MAQLNLLSLCVKDNSERAGHKTPKLFANLIEWLFNQMLPKLNRELEVTHKQASADLKDLVYNTFLEKLSSSSNGFSEEYAKYIADRNGTINVEYYQSIIIWHIATDLCFDTGSGVNEPKNDLLRKVSKDVSDYVMYILVMCPFLLSAGDAKFSFKITCAMVTKFFQKKNFARLPKADACAMLISEYDAFFWPKYEGLDKKPLPRENRVRHQRLLSSDQRSSSTTPPDSVLEPGKCAGAAVIVVSQPEALRRMRIHHTTRNMFHRFKYQQ